MPSPSRTVALPNIILHPGSKLSLQRQLVQALQNAIRQGEIRPGSQLPPSRDAALQLGIGRNTVVEAYAELLADGLIETRGRRGSFVALYLRDAPPPSGEDSCVLQVTERLTNSTSLQKVTQDWRLGQASTQLLPITVWRAACKEVGRHLPPAGYGDPRGHHGLRLAIRNWLYQTRGVWYDAEQIIVTQGTGAAMDLLMQTLLRPGDVCAVEAPGYPRALTAIRQMGACVREVAVDEDGMRVADAFAHTSPMLLHLTPSHQYPMGGRLSGARRQQLSHWVQQHRSLIIENEYDHEFIHEGQNHAPLAASLPAHTVLVSTFAKAISPSLRLGFVAAPLAIAKALASHIETNQLHVSWPVQRTVQWLLQSGELQKHLRRVRRHYAQLRRHLLQSLRQQCPDLHVRGQGGGLHLVLCCREVTHTQQLIATLRQQDIQLQTLPEFGGNHPALLLGYGQMSLEEVDRCVSLLSQVLAGDIG